MTLFTTNIFDIKTAVAEIKNSLLFKDKKKHWKYVQKITYADNLQPYLRILNWQELPLKTSFLCSKKVPGKAEIGGPPNQNWNWQIWEAKERSSRQNMQAVTQQLSRDWSPFADTVPHTHPALSNIVL